MAKRNVRVTTTPTIGFDPSLEPANLPEPSAEAMHACRSWWPYSPLLREAMARVVDRFAARPMPIEKYHAAIYAWKNRAGCTIEEAADDVAFIFEEAGIAIPEATPNNHAK